MVITERVSKEACSSLVELAGNLTPKVQHGHSFEKPIPNPVLQPACHHCCIVALLHFPARKLGFFFPFTLLNLLEIPVPSIWYPVDNFHVLQRKLAVEVGGRDGKGS